MSVTLIQGILISIFALIAGIDFWLEAFFIFRPIIVCTITGIILGDWRLGLVAGALTELAFAGLTPAGGTQPPNPILAGVMTTVLAHTTGNDPTTAIGLALPFSFLMQYIILFCYSSFSFFMARADKAAEEADTDTIVKLNILLTAIIAALYAIVVFLCAYVAQGPMQTFVNSMPDWLKHGFEIAGGILPAVGFGMLLRVMLKAQYIPYLIVGFLMACYLQISNLLPIALIGTAFAVYEYFNSKNKPQAAVAGTNNTGGDDDDGEGI